MNISKISLFASSALIGAAVLVGCGTSDSNLNPNVKVVDGLVKGATATINGTEIGKTNDNGILSATYSTSQIGQTIVASGGIDIDTDKAFDGELRAIVPEGNEEVVLSPLTTMVVALVEGGESEESAKSSIASSLGIDAKYITTDPTANLSDAGAQKAVQAMTKVQKFIEVAAAAKANDSTSDTKSNDYASLFQALAKKVVEEKSVDKAIDKVITEDTSFTADEKEVLTNTATAIKKIAAPTSKEDAAAIAKSIENTTDSIEEKLKENKITEAKNEANVAKDKDLAVIPATVKLGNTMTIGTQAVTIDDNKEFTTTINTSTKSITDFYNISLGSNISLNKAVDTAQSMTLEITITKGNEEVKASIPASVQGTTSSVTVTIPAGSAVTVSQKNLATLQAIVGDSASSNTTSEITLTGVSFNIGSVLNALAANNKISQAVNALNNYLKTNGDYKVKLSATGTEKLVFEHAEVNGTITVTGN